MYCDENNFNSSNSSILEELNPFLEEISDDKVVDEDEKPKDEMFNFDFLKMEESSLLDSFDTQKDEIIETNEDTAELSSDVIETSVEENVVDDSFTSEPTNEESKDELEIQSDIQENIELEETFTVSEENMIEDKEYENVSMDSEDVFSFSEEETFTVIEEEPITKVEEEPAPVQPITTIVSTPVMENSTVNITAPNINVTASKVVLSENSNEQNSAAADYSIKDSHNGEVVFLDDENIIKYYRLTKGGGNAVVTNRRLIIDCATRVELPIENVGGVASSFHTEVKVVKLIFGILFIGICLFACLFDFKTVIHNKMWAIYTIMSVGGVFGLIGILMVCFSFKKKFFLNIFGEGLTPVVSLSSTKREASNSLYGIAVNGQKGKDFAKFTGEIGALLLKIKDSQKRK